MPKTLFLVCGEPSGEAYAARVAHRFRRRFPEVPIEGIGGERLASEGVKLLREYGDISVIGVTEALRRLPAIRSALSAAVDRVRRPDIGAVLLVDFPDFNFRVGIAAAKAGVPVVYYIPPQVWAWRAGRAKTLARFTKGVVVLFPFEEEFLKRSGVNAVFAGHPILDEIAPYLDAPPDPGRFGLPAGKRVVGLLPGSRAGEVAVHLPILLSAARLLLRRFPGIHYALPVARPSLRQAIADGVGRSGLPVTLVDEGRHLLFRGMHAAVAVSGTVTLELALLGVPAVIVYRTSWLSYQVGRRLATVDRIGLPNIASGGKFLPEHIQDDCTPSRIAESAARILSDDAWRDSLRAKGLALRDRLRGPGAPEAVVEMLGKEGAAAWS
ncbi:MAG: lipid-A-disaccharide synthase [Deltaproteobacteria bacterium]